jgi:IS605 OrfB family transposase
MKNLNWINIRKSVNEQIKDVCKKNKLNKHTGDYACKHCVEMWKSAINNHGLGNKFTIRKMLKTRTRKNLVIEPGSVSKSKNVIFVHNLGEMKSNLPLSLITKNSILQYNNNTHQYTIIVPQDKDDIRNVDRSDKIGIDIGVRTFLTTFSDKESLEIATSDKTYPLISKYLKRLDSLQKNKAKKSLMTVKKKVKNFSKVREKYYQKLRNKIDDMHNKVASYLVRNYKEIIIGKVSTKEMVNNETSSLSDITKRRLFALSHYRFRMKLTSMAKKFGATITEVTEYLTSRTCSNCGNINDSLGSSKVYRCWKCPIELDRDINAAINIYKNEKLSR